MDNPALTTTTTTTTAMRMDDINLRAAIDNVFSFHSRSENNFRFYSRYLDVTLILHTNVG